MQRFRRSLMDESPKGLFHELTTTVWNRRIILVALAVLLAQSSLRLINAVVAFVLVPFLATVLKDSDSVLFRSDTHYALVPLIYSVLEFCLVVLVVVFGSRSMRISRIKHPTEEGQSEKVSGVPIIENEDPEPSHYTITGNLANPS